MSRSRRTRASSSMSSAAIPILVAEPTIFCGAKARSEPAAGSRTIVGFCGGGSSRVDAAGLPRPPGRTAGREMLHEATPHVLARRLLPHSPMTTPPPLRPPAPAGAPPPPPDRGGDPPLVGAPVVRLARLPTPPPG